MDNGLEWIGHSQWRISSDILDTYLIGLICLMVLTCNLYRQIFHIFWHIPTDECRSASGPGSILCTDTSDHMASSLLHSAFCKGSWPHPLVGPSQGCLLGSVHRSSLLDWKKDQNWTEPNCKGPDHWLRLHKFWNFSVASCDVCRKIKNLKKTGLSSRHMLDLTHAHSSLIVSLWIIKHGQESVEIWPKTFLYTTWMYVPFAFTISQPNLDRIAWSFDQLQKIRISIHICNLREVVLFAFGTINFTTKDQSQTPSGPVFFMLWTD